MRRALFSITTTSTSLSNSYHTTRQEHQQLLCSNQPEHHRTPPENQVRKWLQTLSALSSLILKSHSRNPPGGESYQRSTSTSTPIWHRPRPSLQPHPNIEQRLPRSPFSQLNPNELHETPAPRRGLRSRALIPSTASSGGFSWRSTTGPPLHAAVHISARHRRWRSQHAARATILALSSHCKLSDVSFSLPPLRRGASVYHLRIS